jgi:hypothetical protein
MNTYENLQIVRSHFFTDKLIFIYIQSNSNIYWFIGIWICCQLIPMNSCWVTFDYSQYSVNYSMSNNKGNFKLFAVTWYGVVLGWLVRSEVELGLLHWCNSGDVMQIGAVVFCTGSKCA